MVVSFIALKCVSQFINVFIGKAEPPFYKEFGFCEFRNYLRLEVRCSIQLSYGRIPYLPMVCAVSCLLFFAPVPHKYRTQVFKRICR